MAGVSPFIVAADKVVYLNPAAFSIPAPGTFGNLSRNSTIGPDLSQFDLTLHKRIPVNEKVNFEFRAEVYNITNSENFGQPNLTITAWSSANVGATPLTNGQFGQITSSNQALNPRQYQFALKLIF